MSNQHRLDTGSVDVAFGTKPLTAAQSARRTRSRGWWYYAEYDLRNMLQWLPSIAVAGIGSPIVYLVALGLGLGTMVTASVGTVDGVSYLEFVAPALLVSTVTMSVVAEMTYPVMGGFKWHRTYFGVQATPVKARDIALGHFAAVMLRFLAQGSIFYLFMLAFGATTSGWSWLAIFAGVLSAAAFGGPLMAYSAMLVDQEAHFALIQRFIVMPMFLFAGTFFPLAAMPGYLQWIGWISPIWHGTELARVAAYGAQLTEWQIAGHLAFLVGLAGVGLVIAVKAFERRLET